MVSKIEYSLKINLELTNLLFSILSIKAEKVLRNAKIVHNDAEMTKITLTLLKMAIKNNTKKKQLLLERKPLPAKNSISSAKRKQKPSSFRRTIKKKMHLKMKERESARILRRCMVEEATLKSYESCMTC